MDFLTMSTEDRAAHFAGLSNEALATTHAELTTALAPIMTASATPPTIDEVEKAKTMFSARDQIETVQAERVSAANKAATDLAEMQKRFSVNDGVETSAGSDEADAPEDADETDEVDADEDPEANADEVDEDTEDPEIDPEVEAADNPFDKDKKKDDMDEDDVTTASARHTGATRLPGSKSGSATRKVGKTTKRPPAKGSENGVVITAAADVEGFASGQRLTMPEVAQAAINRVKGFPKFNAAAAQGVHEESGGQAVLRKFGAARITGTHADSTLTASSGPGQEYTAVKDAQEKHLGNLKASINTEKFHADQTALTAAGFCAPSQVVYDFLASYQVWGLAKYPEVPAPRGGLMTTTGPALEQTYEPDGSDFGWVLTEAQMEAEVLKTCETIVCPEFEDHRLDAVGYCWKIPILTEKGYPELVTDALRLSTVLWAHKMNALNIIDSLALSTSVVASGLGGSFDDTLEALSIIATKERRKYNLGDKAIMEVKMPTYVLGIFLNEVARRLNQPLGSVSEAQIVAEFARHYLAPDWVTDWDELTGANPVYPATFPVMVYPAGTFVTSVEDIINLSAVYDAASLVKNEYTGVFYEQARMLYKAGYGSTKFTVPVCTAGLVGAPVIDCNASTGNFAGGEPQPVV
jgi:hypothetical protein